MRLNWIWGLAALAAWQPLAAAEPDFNAPVPPNGRANPYELGSAELAAARRAGLIHALQYPDIERSMVLPFAMMDRVVDDANRVPWAMRLLTQMGITRFGTTWGELFDKVGLVPYPATEGEGPYYVPNAGPAEPDRPMGISVRPNAAGLDVMSISCAACHARNLFGRSVLGLNNLETRASEFLNYATKTKDVPMPLIWLAAEGRQEDYAAFRAMQHRLQYHAAKNQRGLGNDTALSNTALSLARRGDDPWAEMTDDSLAHPRPSPFETTPADVKPGVWWNMKYKNRGFVDGSMTGNVVISNLLWTEIGLGVDVKEFDAWLDENPTLLRDLTAAVFAAEAPRWTDFFAEASFDVPAAKRGEGVFTRLCAGCHGTYEKAWDAPNSAGLALGDLLATTKVVYPAMTVTHAVGTDPLRSEMMVPLAKELNRLAFTAKRRIAVEPHPGRYVAPPLVGIWARWPYFHNASVPTLCAVLMPGAARPTSFYVARAEDAARDFDRDCVGFPAADDVDARWRRPERFFDTTVEGLGNGGHDEGIFLRDGQPLFSARERLDLLEFLKTL